MSKMIDSKTLHRYIREVYAWPGGYEMFCITADGGILCMECAKENYKEIASDRNYKLGGSGTGWKVIAVDCTANTDSEIVCDHCNKVIQEEWKENEES